jgi:hypothetical protein
MPYAAGYPLAKAMVVGVEADASHTPGCVPEASSESTPIARVPVNASICALVRHDLDETDQKVFIAGGSFGLLEMDASESIGTHVVRLLDDKADPFATTPGDNERWCWDVAIGRVESQDTPTQTYVLALFSAQHDMGGTELRIYDRSDPTVLVALVHLDRELRPYRSAVRPNAGRRDGRHVAK